MKRDSIYLRSIALVVATVFFVTSHTSLPVYAAPSSGDISLPGSFPEQMSQIQIPDQIGKIQEIFDGNGQGGVVIIQDAHAIEDAQRNIQSIITHFQKEYGVDLVTLEGASSALDAQIFRSFPEKEALQSVLEEYFASGELVGSVAAAIMSENESRYHGIEDWDLYESGLIFFLAAMEQEQELLKKIERVENKMLLEKQRLFSKDLQTADRALDEFRSSAADLIPVLKKLSMFQKPAAGTQLALIYEELARDPMGAESLELEVKNLAQLVRSELEEREGTLEARKDLFEFQKSFQAFQTSRLAPDEFALSLKDLVIKYRIKVKVSKRLDYLVSHQFKMRDIKGTQLFDEFEVFAQSVKEGLFRSPQERELDQQTEIVYLLKQFVELEINREGWNRIKTLIGNIDSGNSGNLPADLLDLLRSMRYQEAFYRNAEVRDGVFIDKLARLMSNYGTSEAVMVAGGFHADGLRRHLRDLDISYALIMPKIGIIPESTPYRDQMRGEVTWGEYFEEEDGGINVYKAFVRATRDRVLNNTEKTNGVVLKQWRDQIVRDLSDQGRVEEAGKYTDFIDELTLRDAAQRKLPEWYIKVDKFVDGLSRLEENNQLNRQNILKLLQPASIAALTSGAITPGDYNHVLGLIVRDQIQEAADALMAAKETKHTEQTTQRAPERETATDIIDLDDLDPEFLKQEKVPEGFKSLIDSLTVPSAGAHDYETRRNRADLTSILRGAPIGQFHSNHMPSEIDATLDDFYREVDANGEEFVYVFRGLENRTRAEIIGEGTAHLSAAAAADGVRDFHSPEYAARAQHAYARLGAADIPNAVFHAAYFNVGNDVTLHTTLDPLTAKGFSGGGQNDTVIIYKIPVKALTDENVARPVFASNAYTGEQEVAFYYGIPQEFVYLVVDAPSFDPSAYQPGTKVDRSAGAEQVTNRSDNRVTKRPAEADSTSALLEISPDLTDTVYKRGLGQNWLDRFSAVTPGERFEKNLEDAIERAKNRGATVNLKALFSPAVAQQYQQYFEGFSSYQQVKVLEDILTFHQFSAERAREALRAGYAPEYLAALAEVVKSKFASSQTRENDIQSLIELNAFAKARDLNLEKFLEGGPLRRDAVLLSVLKGAEEMNLDLGQVLIDYAHEPDTVSMLINLSKETGRLYYVAGDLDRLDKVYREIRNFGEERVSNALKVGIGVEQLNRFINLRSLYPVGIARRLTENMKTDAEANGWNVAYDAPNSLSYNQQVAVTDLAWIHLTRFLPENGKIKSLKHALGWGGRETLHGVLNGTVTGHMAGDWSDASYLILIPFHLISKERVENVLEADSYFRVDQDGTFTLPEGSLILGLKGSPRPQSDTIGNAPYLEVQDFEGDLTKIMGALGYDRKYVDTRHWASNFGGVGPSTAGFAAREELDHSLHEGTWRDNYEGLLLNDFEHNLLSFFFTGVQFGRATESQQRSAELNGMTTLEYNMYRTVRGRLSRARSLLENEFQEKIPVSVQESVEAYIRQYFDFAGISEEKFEQFAALNLDNDQFNDVAMEITVKGIRRWAAENLTEGWSVTDLKEKFERHWQEYRPDYKSDIKGESLANITELLAEQAAVVAQRGEIQAPAEEMAAIARSDTRKDTALDHPLTPEVEGEKKTKELLGRTAVDNLKNLKFALADLDGFGNKNTIVSKSVVGTPYKRSVFRRVLALLDKLSNHTIYRGVGGDETHTTYYSENQDANEFFRGIVEGIDREMNGSYEFYRVASVEDLTGEQQERLEIMKQGTDGEAGDLLDYGRHGNGFNFAVRKGAKAKLQEIFPQQDLRFFDVDIATVSFGVVQADWVLNYLKDMTAAAGETDDWVVDGKINPERVDEFYTWMQRLANDMLSEAKDPKAPEMQGKGRNRHYLPSSQHEFEKAIRKPVTRDALLKLRGDLLTPEDQVIPGLDRISSKLTEGLEVYTQAGFHDRFTAEKYNTIYQFSVSSYFRSIDGRAFHHLQDPLGYDAGNKVIKWLAQHLSEKMSDLYGEDILVGRIAPDGFYIAVNGERGADPIRGPPTEQEVANALDSLAKQFIEEFKDSEILENHPSIKDLDSRFVLYRVTASDSRHETGQLFETANMLQAAGDYVESMKNLNAADLQKATEVFESGNAKLVAFNADKEKILIQSYRDAVDRQIEEAYQKAHASKAATVRAEIRERSEPAQETTGVVETDQSARPSFLQRVRGFLNTAPGNFLFHAFRFTAVLAGVLMTANMAVEGVTLGAGLVFGLAIAGALSGVITNAPEFGSFNSMYKIKKAIKDANEVRARTKGETAGENLDTQRDGAEEADAVDSGRSRVFRYLRSITVYLLMFATYAPTFGANLGFGFAPALLSQIFAPGITGALMFGGLGVALAVFLVGGIFLNKYADVLVDDYLSNIKSDTLRKIVIAISTSLPEFITMAIFMTGAATAVSAGAPATVLSAAVLASAFNVIMSNVSNTGLAGYFTQKFNRNLGDESAEYEFSRGQAMDAANLLVTTAIFSFFIATGGSFVAFLIGGMFATGFGTPIIQALLNKDEGDSNTINDVIGGGTLSNTVNIAFFGAGFLFANAISPIAFAFTPVLGLGLAYLAVSTLLLTAPFLVVPFLKGATRENVSVFFKRVLAAAGVGNVFALPIIMALEQGGVIAASGLMFSPWIPVGILGAAIVYAAGRRSVAVVQGREEITADPFVAAESELPSQSIPALEGEPIYAETARSDTRDTQEKTEFRNEFYRLKRGHQHEAAADLARNQSPENLTAFYSALVDIENALMQRDYTGARSIIAERVQNEHVRNFFNRVVSIGEAMHNAESLSEMEGVLDQLLALDESIRDLGFEGDALQNLFAIRSILGLRLIPFAIRDAFKAAGKRGDVEFMEGVVELYKRKIQESTSKTLKDRELSHKIPEEYLNEINAAREAGGLEVFKVIPSELQEQEPADLSTHEIPDPTQGKGIDSELPSIDAIRADSESPPLNPSADAFMKTNYIEKDAAKFNEDLEKATTPLTVKITGNEITIPKIMDLSPNIRTLSNLAFETNDGTAKATTIRMVSALKNLGSENSKERIKSIRSSVHDAASKSEFDSATDYLADQVDSGSAGIPGVTSQSTSRALRLKLNERFSKINAMQREGDTDSVRDSVEALNESLSSALDVSADASLEEMIESAKAKTDIIAEEQMAALESTEGLGLLQRLLHFILKSLKRAEQSTKAGLFKKGFGALGKLAGFFVKNDQFHKGEEAKRKLSVLLNAKIALQAFGARLEAGEKGEIPKLAGKFIRKAFEALESDEELEIGKFLDDFVGVVLDELKGKEEKRGLEGALARARKRVKNLEGFANLAPGIKNILIFGALFVALVPGAAAALETGDGVLSAVNPLVLKFGFDIGLGLFWVLAPLVAPFLAIFLEKFIGKGLVGMVLKALEKGELFPVRLWKQFVQGKSKEQVDEEIKAIQGNKLFKIGHNVFWRVLIGGGLAFLGLNVIGLLGGAALAVGLPAGIGLGAGIAIFFGWRIRNFQKEIRESSKVSEEVAKPGLIGRAKGAVGKAVDAVAGFFKGRRKSNVGAAGQRTDASQEVEQVPVGTETGKLRPSVVRSDVRNESAKAEADIAALQNEIDEKIEREETQRKQRTRDALEDIQDFGFNLKKARKVGEEAGIEFYEAEVNADEKFLMGVKTNEDGEKEIVFLARYPFVAQEGQTEFDFEILGEDAAAAANEAVGKDTLNDVLERARDATKARALMLPIVVEDAGFSGRSVSELMKLARGRPFLQKLLAHMADLPQDRFRFGATINVLSRDDNEAHFSAASKAVRLAPGNMSDPSFAEELIVHELLHALIMDVIEGDEAKDRFIEEFYSENAPRGMVDLKNAIVKLGYDHLGKPFLELSRNEKFELIQEIVVRALDGSPFFQDEALRQEIISRFAKQVPALGEMLEEAAVADARPDARTPALVPAAGGAGGTITPTDGISRILDVWDGLENAGLAAQVQTQINRLAVANGFDSVSDALEDRGGTITTEEISRRANLQASIYKAADAESDAMAADAMRSIADDIECSSCAIGSPDFSSRDDLQESFRQQVIYHVLRALEETQNAARAAEIAIEKLRLQPAQNKDLAGSDQVSENIEAAKKIVQALESEAARADQPLQTKVFGLVGQGLDQLVASLASGSDSEAEQGAKAGAEVETRKSEEFRPDSTKVSEEDLLARLEQYDRTGNLNPVLGVDGKALDKQEIEQAIRDGRMTLDESGHLRFTDEARRDLLPDFWYHGTNLGAVEAMTQQEKAELNKGNLTRDKRYADLYTESEVYGESITLEFDFSSESLDAITHFGNTAFLTDAFIRQNVPLRRLSQNSKTEIIRRLMGRDGITPEVLANALGMSVDEVMEVYASRETSSTQIGPLQPAAGGAGGIVTPPGGTIAIADFMNNLRDPALAAQLQAQINQLAAANGFESVNNALEDRGESITTEEISRRANLQAALYEAAEAADDSKAADVMRSIADNIECSSCAIGARNFADNQELQAFFRKQLTIHVKQALQQTQDPEQAVKLVIDQLKLRPDQNGDLVGLGHVPANIETAKAIVETLDSELSTLVSSGLDRLSASIAPHTAWKKTVNDAALRGTEAEEIMRAQGMDFDDWVQKQIGGSERREVEEALMFLGFDREQIAAISDRIIVAGRWATPAEAHQAFKGGMILETEEGKKVFINAKFTSGSLKNQEHVADLIAGLVYDEALTAGLRPQEALESGSEIKNKLVGNNKFGEEFESIMGPQVERMRKFGSGIAPFNADEIFDSTNIESIQLWDDGPRDGRVYHVRTSRNDFFLIFVDAAGRVLEAALNTRAGNSFGVINTEGIGKEKMRSGVKFVSLSKKLLPLMQDSFDEALRKTESGELTIEDEREKRGSIRLTEKHSSKVYLPLINVYYGMEDVGNDFVNNIMMRNLIRILGPAVLTNYSGAMRQISGQAAGISFGGFTMYDMHGHRTMDTFPMHHRSTVIHELTHERFNILTDSEKQEVSDYFTNQRPDLGRVVLSAPAYKSLEGNDVRITNEVIATIVGWLANGNTRMMKQDGALRRVWGDIKAADIDILIKYGFLPSEFKPLPEDRKRFSRNENNIDMDYLKRVYPQAAAKDRTNRAEVRDLGMTDKAISDADAGSEVFPLGGVLGVGFAPIQRSDSRQVFLEVGTVLDSRSGKEKGIVLGDSASNPETHYDLLVILQNGQIGRFSVAKNNIKDPKKETDPKKRYEAEFKEAAERFGSIVSEITKMTDSGTLERKLTAHNALIDYVTGVQSRMPQELEEDIRDLIRMIRGEAYAGSLRNLSVVELAVIARIKQSLGSRLAAAKRQEAMIRVAELMPAFREQLTKQDGGAVLEGLGIGGGDLRILEAGRNIISFEGGRGERYYDRPVSDFIEGHIAEEFRDAVRAEFAKFRLSAKDINFQRAERIKNQKTLEGVADQLRPEVLQGLVVNDFSYGRKELDNIIGLILGASRNLKNERGREALLSEVQAYAQKNRVPREIALRQVVRQAGIPVELGIAQKVTDLIASELFRVREQRLPRGETAIKALPSVASDTGSQETAGAEKFREEFNRLRREGKFEEAVKAVEEIPEDDQEFYGILEDMEDALLELDFKHANNIIKDNEFDPDVKGTFENVVAIAQDARAAATLEDMTDIVDKYKNLTEQINSSGRKSSLIRGQRDLIRSIAEYRIIPATVNRLFKKAIEEGNAEVAGALLSLLEKAGGQSKILARYRQEVGKLMKAQERQTAEAVDTATTETGAETSEQAESVPKTQRSDLRVKSKATTPEEARQEPVPAAIADLADDLIDGIRKGNITQASETALRIAEILEENSEISVAEIRRVISARALMMYTQEELTRVIDRKDFASASDAAQFAELISLLLIRDAVLDGFYTIAYYDVSERNASNLLETLTALREKSGLGNISVLIEKEIAKKVDQGSLRKLGPQVRVVDVQKTVRRTGARDNPLVPAVWDVNSGNLTIQEDRLVGIRESNNEAYENDTFGNEISNMARTYIAIQIARKKFQSRTGLMADPETLKKELVMALFLGFEGYENVISVDKNGHVSVDRDLLNSFVKEHLADAIVAAAA